MSGTDVLRRIDVRLALSGMAASLLGAIDVFLFGALLFPVAPEHLDQRQTVIGNAILFVPFMAIAMILARRWGAGHRGRLRPWVEANRAPTAAERDMVLRLPLHQVKITATFWLLAIATFTALNAIIAPEVAPFVPVLLGLGGITTTTVDYLLSERITRPLIARALQGGLPDRPIGPGVGGRAAIVWAGATGVPLLGIALTAIGGLLDEDVSRELFAVGVLFLVGVAVVVSLTATIVYARSLGEPLADIRAALERVEQGDFSAQVTVDDGSQLGLVEAGFNRMAAGLRERERVRDVFGRHVGHEVARAALEGDVELGGEVRDVGALFVDLCGSTRLAAQLPPQQVVALLNDFFAVVVAVTEAHGGFVNKFEGDGAVCVFGAPVPLDDPAGSALAAARELRARLLDDLPRVDAAVGVSAGQAVAGNVGSEERFEYTVIGDPVNEAARLCDLAKQRPERLVASDAAVERADPRESARWEVGEATVLRGRSAPTHIATAAGAAVERVPPEPGPGTA